MGSAFWRSTVSLKNVDMQVAYRHLKGHLYPENKTIKPFKKTKPGEIEVKQCVLTTVRTL